MKLYKWIVKLSVFSLIFGFSSMLHANNEFSYCYADENGELTFTPEYPLDWENSSFTKPSGVLDY